MPNNNTNAPLIPAIESSSSGLINQCSYTASENSTHNHSQWQPHTHTHTHTLIHPPRVVSGGEVGVHVSRVRPEGLLHLVDEILLRHARECARW